MSQNRITQATAPSTLTLASQIAAIDFFTVYTITFKVLYCFVVLSHGRRRIIHFNTTRNPTAEWTVQQIVEAFPYDTTPRFLPFRAPLIRSIPPLAFTRACDPARRAHPAPPGGLTITSRLSFHRRMEFSVGTGFT